MWSDWPARVLFALWAFAGTLAAAAPASPPRESAELRLEVGARGELTLRFIVFTLPPEVGALSGLLGRILGSDLRDVFWDVDTHKRVATLTARASAPQPPEGLAVRAEVQLGPLSDALSMMGVPTLTVVLHHPRCGMTQCSLGRPRSPDASPVVQYAETFPTPNGGPTVRYQFGYFPAQAGKSVFLLSGAFLILAGLRGFSIWKDLLNVGQGTIATLALWALVWVLAGGDLLLAFLLSAESRLPRWGIELLGIGLPILILEVGLLRWISGRSSAGVGAGMVLLLKVVHRTWVPAALAATGIVLFRESSSLSWVGWIVLAGMAAAWTAGPTRRRNSFTEPVEDAFGRAIPSNWAVSLLVPAVAVECPAWFRLGDIGCLGVYAAALGAVALLAAVTGSLDFGSRGGSSRTNPSSREPWSGLLDSIWFLATLVFLARVAGFPFNFIEGDEGWRFLVLGVLSRLIGGLVPRLAARRGR